MFAALVSLVGAAGTVLLVLKHLKACKSTGDTPSRTLFVRCGLILLSSCSSPSGPPSASWTVQTPWQLS